MLSARASPVTTLKPATVLTLALFVVIVCCVLLAAEHVKVEKGVVRMHAA
jgi:hypothetical protein